MTSTVKPGPAANWWSLLCASIKKGDKEGVTEILNEHHDHEQQVKSTETVLSESPLHLAVLHGKDEIFDLLLSFGLDITVTNLYGETALHAACRTGNTDIVDKLLEAGTDIDNKDCGECTPLFHAIYSNQPTVVRKLIKAGCDLDTLNEELMSPLDHAVFYNQQPLISLLLKGGCAIDKTMGMVYYPGHYSNSILFSLWANSDIENVKILIDAGYHIPYNQLIKLFKIAQQLDWDDSLLKTVVKLIRNPMSLKDCCRVSVRRHLVGVKQLKGKPLQRLLSDLPLPQILKAYLSML